MPANTNTTEVVQGALLIEVCVDSVESAIAAINGGADRLEVCANLANGGGTTPTIGLLKAIQSTVDVPLMVMIRPRTGDFYYTREELGIMLEDIRILKHFGGIRGFVLGVLTREARIDVECMKVLVDEILPLEVCFHRAFDMTRDPIEALQDIDDIGGISRILTSGQKSKAPEGLTTLEALFKTRKELVEDDAWGLTIMPGSGVNGATLPKLFHALMPLGLREIHLSGGRWIPSNMLFKRNGMGMNSGDKEFEWSVWRTEQQEVQLVREIADSLWRDYFRGQSPNQE
ncbi:copper homeostasis CutC domain-containing protein [Crepidotus variabilis]|uniref:Copper homeostasis protein cutC homolog n=1 Tax=Crepidotus variabilis TaxID=179855 RepID=A0A9P6JTL6_9AGAR|nr:copper homeostasis CutC domain-containing protein [Crepidotus variabilis]